MNEYIQELQKLSQQIKYSQELAQEVRDKLEVMVLNMEREEVVLESKRLVRNDKAE